MIDIALRASDQADRQRARLAAARARRAGARAGHQGRGAGRRGQARAAPQGCRLRLRHRRRHRGRRPHRRDRRRWCSGRASSTPSRRCPCSGAGGVGRGRQMAAALALGCEGVWCGSIWLKTVESEVTPEIKAQDVRGRLGRRRADAHRHRQAVPDAAQHVHRRVGKARRARDAAGAAAGAPLVGPGTTRVERVRAKEFLDLSGRPDRRRHARRNLGAQRRP